MVKDVFIEAVFVFVLRMAVLFAAVVLTFAAVGCVPERPSTARGKTGRRLGQCLSCAEKRAAYRSKRYVPPSEVNKFPPAPEILNHVYWPKYS